MTVDYSKVEASFEILEHVASYPAVPAVSDPARLRLVESLGLLDTDPEESFDRLVRAASRLLNAPTSVVTIIDDKRQFLKSAIGLAEPWHTIRETPLSYSFCQHSLGTQKPLIIEDSRVDPLVRESPSSWQQNMIAYAGVPLIVDNQALGSLCVIDDVPRAWGPAEIEVLQELAQWATTEIQLRRELARRAEIERMKDEFVSVIGHELRTPLTSIRASLGLMASGKLGDVTAPAQRMLNVAIRNSEHLMTLLNDVIDVERLQTGRVQMDVAPVHVGRLLRQAKDTMQGLADQAGVHIVDLSFDATLPLDEHRMLQVLNNLISNAIKFSPPGGSVVLAGNATSEHVLITVRDQGRGIPTEMLESIFDRFQQVESGDAREKGGAGLGLPIARGIVEQLGGTIWAESTPDSGSTFLMRFPLSSARETSAG